MRSTAYKCDKCGNPVDARHVIKINATVQAGIGASEKKPFDFCRGCFSGLKAVFSDYLKDSGDIQPVSSDGCEAAAAGLQMGPLTETEKVEILRLHIMEGLSPEDIAVKMNRLPRGIKRTINTAERHGEIEMWRNRFLKDVARGNVKQVQTDDAAEAKDKGAPRSHSSGVSNRRVTEDKYTAPPKVVEMDGVKYDVGCILALARGGWSAAKIADEKNYSVSEVAKIMEEHRR